MSVHPNHILWLVRVGISSSIALCCVSCSWLGLSSSGPEIESQKSEILDIPATNSPAAIPFELEVVDEVNDGERLHVLGSISAATTWRMEDVVVKLTGLNAGNIAGVSYLPLQTLAKAQGTGGSAKPGEKYTFSLSLAAAGITDYQLELLWGKDAEQYLKEIAKNDPGSVEIRNIEVTTFQDECGLSGCSYRHKIAGKLVNATPFTINKVVLGVGFVRVQQGTNLDLSREIPENEERVEVPNLNLQAGASRSIKLDVERSVPDAELKPIMRIISFE